MNALPLALISCVFLSSCTLSHPANVEYVQDNTSALTQEKRSPDEPFEQAFLSRDKLATNTAKISIPFDEILRGGPPKDGIPAIHDPKFLSFEKAEKSMEWLGDDVEGISVVVGDEAKFYPFNILNWHEIVTDVVGDKKVAVTFCPLCASSIVYNRIVDEKELRFGVSGKLYNSNLLMYDHITESLWSQSRGEAVVGEYLGTKLEVVDSDVLNYSQFKEKNPGGIVLSDDTGELRRYDTIPYGDYSSNEDLYFPVDEKDVRLPRKEILYVVNDDDTSVAFVRLKLKQEGSAQIQVDEKLYEALYDQGDITVTQGGREIPGYNEMFFSWATHNENSKNLWGASEE